MYAIICDARMGDSLGINTLALVDRKKSKKLWWTSDNVTLILGYKKRDAAVWASKRLKRNNARVVDYNAAMQIIASQNLEINHTLDHQAGMAAMEDGWDGHKGAW